MDGNMKRIRRTVGSDDLLQGYGHLKVSKKYDVN